MLDWRNLFAFGESPYFAMYRCGLNGIPLDDVLDYLRQLNIPVRERISETTTMVRSNVVS